MPVHFLRRTRPLSGLLSLILAAVASPLLAAAAQAPTGGTVSVSVTGERGKALSSVAISLESAGKAIRITQTDRAGRATLNGVLPGTYSLLVEQIGYQPVRYRDLRVELGAESRLTAHLELRPPPITSVDELPANASIVGAATEDFLPAYRLRIPLLREEATELAQSSASFLGLDTRRELFGANGLGAGFAQLRIDGLRETLLRHPGLPGEPVSSSLYSPRDLANAALSTTETDARHAGSVGGLLDLRTRNEMGSASFRPWLSVAPGIGAAAVDSRGDSSAMSLQGGVRMGGGIKGDTAAWAFNLHGYSLRTRTADPFELPLGGDAAQFGAEIRAAAQVGGGSDPEGFTVPRVRSISGANGNGKVRVSVGSIAAITLRAAASSWTEKNPLLGMELVNGADVSLKANDRSFGLMGNVGQGKWSSTTNIGLRAATRDWTAGTTPSTAIVAEGIAFGTPTRVPGKFTERAIEFVETGSYHYGAHLVRGGVSAQRRTVNWDLNSAETGSYLFGDLADFQSGSGSYYKTAKGPTSRDIIVKNSAGFLQDTWQANPLFELKLGVRYDKEQLPDQLVSMDEDLETTTGAVNNLMPTNDKSMIAPAGSFRLDLGGKGRTFLTGGAAITLLPFDLTTLAEVSESNGGIAVSRADGAVAWPAATTATTTKSFSLFTPGIQRPRTHQGNVGFSTAMGGGTLSIRGSYAHTDYLTRRDEWNRHQEIPSTGSDGRPIYGELKQYGALIVPATGSNRRFPEYDAITVITGDGYVDHYEVSAELERSLSTRLGLHLGYAYGKTEDNLIGQLSSDPSDRLSPFPGGLGGEDWTKGRSDLDVPHRLVADLRYGGEGSFALTARYRYQSGLPFTPGASRGVDLNGDGSGNNDPVALNSSVSGLSDLIGRESCLSGQLDGMAARNSCRDPGVHSLDIGAQWRLSGNATRGVYLKFDALNVIGSAVGVRDHAAVLVDPSGSIQRNATGKYVLPLVANERFGELLSRRSEPRLLRFGITMEN